MQIRFINRFTAVLIFNLFVFSSLESMPQEVMTDFTAELIEKKQDPAVIFIYANYCGACNQAKEDLPDIIKNCPKNISFYQCNIQEKFGMGFLKLHHIVTQEIDSIPVFIFRNKGKLVHFEIGYPGKQKIIQMINQYS